MMLRLLAIAVACAGLACAHVQPVGAAAAPTADVTTCGTSTIAQNRALFEEAGGEFAVHPITPAQAAILAAGEGGEAPPIVLRAKWVALGTSPALPPGVISVGLFDEDECYLGSGYRTPSAIADVLRDRSI